MKKITNETELDRLHKILALFERMIPSERDRLMAYMASKYQLRCPQCGEDYP